MVLAAQRSYVSHLAPGLAVLDKCTAHTLNALVSEIAIAKRENAGKSCVEFSKQIFI